MTRPSRRPRIVAALTVAFTLMLCATVVIAQFRDRRGRDRDGIIYDRNGVPDWKVDPDYKEDVFTFARLRYDSWRGRGGWATDHPDSDLNFSFRLQQLTTMKVNPNPVIVDLNGDKIFDYPFIYMIEPGSLYFSENEVKRLRRYLLNGGFLMVDDFWGGDEYDNFYDEIKRVFPDREPVDLEIDHPIFHIVYDLKKKPQVPSISHGMSGRTYESRPGPDDGSEVHYRAIFDDDGRMMVIICHNTDLGDGWEREGEHEYYFKEFSEKQAYPMGINIVFYAMTH